MDAHIVFEAIASTAYELLKKKNNCWKKTFLLVRSSFLHSIGTGRFLITSLQAKYTEVDVLW
jgi:hypothetical protein